MKIKCIANLACDVPVDSVLHYCSSSSLVPLTINKEYIVYALSEYYQNVWYCICDDEYTYHPTWIPSSFFQVCDSRLSQYWVFSFKEDFPKNRFVFAFPEWANQIDYYDNLVDGEDREVEIFRCYKELMDLEFPDASISEMAQIGDEEWLICPLCSEAWEQDAGKDALVRCPKCRKIMKNPRYRDEMPSF